MSGLFLTLVSCSLLLASVETEISWNANAEPDLAGYRVHVGTASGNYSQIYDVGKYTGYSLTLDEPGVTYFFAVTAYDTAGNESSYSEEVTAIFGTEKDDVTNYTNRSPYPILHLLREESLSKAIDSHPDPEGIPEKNIELMERLGLEKVKDLQKSGLIDES